MSSSKKSMEAETKIIIEARKLFLEKGFSATSLRDITKLAGVPLGLVYHYYENKIALWKAVKKHLLSQYTEEKSLGREEFKTFREFLEYVIRLRFDFYDQNPDIARLISWQRLEPESYQLTGIQTSTLMIDLTPFIRHFQEIGEIRKEIDPVILSYLILNQSSATAFDIPDFFDTNNNVLNKEKYVETLIDFFVKSCLSVDSSIR